MFQHTMIEQQIALMNVQARELEIARENATRPKDED